MTTATAAFYLDDADPPAKRAIMVAALKLFADRGIDGVSIRDVAARAGFTNPALFRHFAGKDALALALFDTCYRHLGAVVGQPQGADFAARLHATLARYLLAVERTPDAVLYVHDNLRRFWPLLPPDARRLSLLDQMRRLVADGVAAGDVAAATDPTLAAGAIIGVLAQTARLVEAGEIAGPATASLGAVERLVTRMLAP